MTIERNERMDVIFVIQTSVSDFYERPRYTLLRYGTFKFGVTRAYKEIPRADAQRLRERFAILR